jgi:hypothetical protein
MEGELRVSTRRELNERFLEKIEELLEHRPSALWRDCLREFLTRAQEVRAKEHADSGFGYGKREQEPPAPPSLNPFARSNSERDQPHRNLQQDMERAREEVEQKRQQRIREGYEHPDGTPFRRGSELTGHESAPARSNDSISGESTHSAQPIGAKGSTGVRVKRRNPASSANPAPRVQNEDSQPIRSNPFQSVTLSPSNEMQSQSQQQQQEASGGPESPMRAGIGYQSQGQRQSHAFSFGSEGDLGGSQMSLSFGTGEQHQAFNVPEGARVCQNAEAQGQIPASSFGSGIGQVPLSFGNGQQQNGGGVFSALSRRGGDQSVQGERRVGEEQ